MAKKRDATGKRRPPGDEPPRDRGAAVALAVAVAVVAVLALVLVGTSLAVDTTAAASFDAPKRAIALLGTALAAAIALLGPRAREAPRDRWRDVAPLCKAALLLSAAALAGAFLSAVGSPRRAVSLDALRSIALLALLIPLGASRLVERGRAWLLGCFVSACALNAAVSILQGLGLFHPFALETIGSRQETGAYAGNVGYLAIAVSLSSVLCLALLLSKARAPVRVLAGGALVLFLADLLVNRNLTAIASVLAGIAALLIVRIRRRALLPLVAAAGVAAVLVAAYPPLSQRARAALGEARAGNWDALLSYRGGPWAAALEMTRERPLLGFGPGTFPAEYVSHRLAAEIRAHRRFVSPLLSSSYGEAHNDYLQAASDAGIPVALLAVAAAGCLLAAAARAAWSGRDPEAALLFAVLVTGAVVALTWFPLQRPITAVPLLLLAGRAWRVGASAETQGVPS